jgi:hypothetical protein
LTYEVLATSVLTVITGVLVLTLGQLALKFFIEPLHAQAKTVGEIAYAIFFYADIYCNPGTTVFEMQREAADTLRQKAGQLIATTNAIRGYGFWTLVRLAPDLADVTIVARNLTFLSNSVFHGRPEENEEARQEIVKRLRLKRLERSSQTPAEK